MYDDEPDGGPPRDFYSGGPRSPLTPASMVKHVLLTMFCCQPLGVVSLVLLALAHTSNAAGDHRGAIQYEDQSQRFAYWAFAAGIVQWILVVAFVAVSER